MANSNKKKTTDEKVEDTKPDVSTKTPKVETNTPTKDVKPKEDKPKEDTYTVKKGDKIADVANAHSVSVGWIKYVNGLTSNTLKVGRILCFTL